MIDYTLFPQNKKRVLSHVARNISSFVYESIKLEQIDYSFHEVLMLEEGITVGRHTLEDQNIVLNQIAAWHHLLYLLNTNNFDLRYETVCQLHNIVAYKEALTWGEFRDGDVSISGTPYIPPSYRELEFKWLIIRTKQVTMDNTIEFAIFVFLEMARCQFFYDANKRTGRFMMNGILLSHGYPAINLLHTDEEEFNDLMLDLYTSGDYKPMTEFMIRQYYE